MSHLLARIMLALFMLPLTGVVYVLVVAVLIAHGSFRNDVVPFMIANVAAAACVGTYWCLLWRREVVWTRRRIVGTIGAAFGTTVAGLGAGAIGTTMTDSFGVFIGGVFAILLWPVATIFVWRESPDERRRRLHVSGARLRCPQCGYDMSGLERSQCPECGARFTLDDLVARQSSRAQVELQDEVAGPDSDSDAAG